MSRNTDADELARGIFKIDLAIRYVGIVDKEYQVLVSKMREGIDSFTPVNTERDFVSIMPPIIVDAVKNLESYLGDVDAVNIRYERAVLAFYPVKDFVVVLSFGPEIVTPFLSRIASEIKKLAEKQK